jgi:glycerol-3-phosphate acyltransferase PlsY
VATWAIIAAFLRYSSLAALVAAVFAPFFTAFIFGIDATFVAVSAMAVLLVWRHRANIARLMAGTESRIGAKKTT